MNYCNKSGVLLTDIRWRPISAQSAIPLGSSLILIRRVSTYVCLYHGDNMKLFNVINDFWIHLSFVTIKKKKKKLSFAPNWKAVIIIKQILAVI